MRRKVLFLAMFLIMTMMILLITPNLAFAFSYTSPIYVNAATGSDGYNGTSPTYTGGNVGPKATITAAINSLTPDGIIYVAAGTYYENLSISESLTLQGAGSKSTVINGGGHAVYKSVISIAHDGISASIRDLTITNGECVNGGGVLNYYNSDITIEDCAISNNVAGSGNYGGGIYNTGPMSIKNCIIENNHSEIDGGGIYTHSNTLEITDSQIINNSADSRGGGIYNSNGTVTIHNSSIANNTAPTGAGIFDISATTVYAQNNWWGTSSGPGGNINDPITGKLANGSGNAIYGHIYFDSWLKSDPFSDSGDNEEPVWVRTMPMTCYRVWINEDNNFQFIFWYPFKDNNWVRIYDISGKMVYEIDMPYDNPNLIVDLPDGMYTVKTYNVDQANPIQTFVIGKP
jgi:hypothetical protein